MNNDVVTRSCASGDYAENNSSEAVRIQVLLASQLALTLDHRNWRQRKHAVFLFLTDLSFMSVLREMPLLHFRRKAGDLHFFIHSLVVKIPDEGGLEGVEARYIEWWGIFQRRLLIRFVGLFRSLAHAVMHPDECLLGRKALMVLARPKIDGGYV